ncbi:MAG TPA: SDR family NAD(P)-dependent oxidoreductase, partial [Candidatus Sumerlaeia bacterium]|nr:SDR family NAD(P)-dependent oxidoreductase [Candidatus Sumerlaeia bacterium]
MLNGQVALVTGAGRGIGRAIALALAKNGADIVISDIMKESVDEAVKEVEALGRKALGILGDVSKFADCEAMVNAGK